MADVRVEVIVTQEGKSPAARTCRVPGDLLDPLSSRILGPQHDQKQDNAEHTVGTAFVDAYRELMESDPT